MSGSELLRGGVELFHHPSLRAHRQPSGGADGPNPSLELQKQPVGGEPSEAPRAKASPYISPISPLHLSQRRILILTLTLALTLTPTLTLTQGDPCGAGRDRRLLEPLVSGAYPTSY